MQKRVLGENKAAPKKMVAILLSLLVIFSLAACSNQSGSQEPAPPIMNDGGENSSVGVIEKGNTHLKHIYAVVVYVLCYSLLCFCKLHIRN